MPPQRNGLQSKHWTFTLNNYSEADVERLKCLGDPVCYLIAGKEVGEGGTPHLQGFVSLSCRKRLRQVKELLGSNPHVEIARNVNAAIEYCKKDGDFFEVGARSGGAGSRSDLDAFKDDVKQGNLDLSSIREIHSEVYAKYPRFCIEYVQDHLPQKAVEVLPLRAWQISLTLKLAAEPDDRKIIFIVDRDGNAGKTWFAHYYRQTNEKVQVLLPGKKSDMTYALDTRIRVLFVDAPRSKQGEYLQYDFLEEVKNGYIFSGKYESRIKQLERVHIVVMMNEMPDLEKLSADRYDIVEVS